MLAATITTIQQRLQEERSKSRPTMRANSLQSMLEMLCRWKLYEGLDGYENRIISACEAALRV